MWRERARDWAKEDQVRTGGIGERDELEFGSKSCIVIWRGLKLVLVMVMVKGWFWGREMNGMVWRGRRRRRSAHRGCIRTCFDFKIRTRNLNPS